MSRELSVFIMRHRRFARFLEDPDIDELRIDTNGDISAKRGSFRTEEPGIGRTDARALFDAIGVTEAVSVVEMGLHRWTCLRPPVVRPDAVVFVTRVRERRLNGEELVATGLLSPAEFGLVRETIEAGRGVLVVSDDGHGHQRLLASVLACACESNRHVVVLERDCRIDTGELPVTCLRADRIGIAGYAVGDIIAHADTVFLDGATQDDWAFVLSRRRGAAVVGSARGESAAEGLRSLLGARAAQDDENLSDSLGLHLVVFCQRQNTEAHRVVGIYRLTQAAVPLAQLDLGLSSVELVEVAPERGVQDLSEAEPLDVDGTNELPAPTPVAPGEAPPPPDAALVTQDEAELRMRRRMGRPPAPNAWEHAASAPQDVQDLPDSETVEVSPVPRSLASSSGEYKGRLLPMERRKFIARPALGVSRGPRHSAELSRRGPAGGLSRAKDASGDSNEALLRRSRRNAAIERPVIPKMQEDAARDAEDGIEIHMGGAAAAVGGSPASEGNGCGRPSEPKSARTVAVLAEETTELSVDDLKGVLGDEVIDESGSR